MAMWVPHEEPHDISYWVKKYEVFSISRLYLSSLGFPTEQIESLTDEDMARIADTYNNQNFLGFEEDMQFLVSLELAEKEQRP